VYRFPGPDGKSIMHAEIRIGDLAIMLCDEMPEMGAEFIKSKQVIHYLHKRIVKNYLSSKNRS